MNNQTGEASIYEYNGLERIVISGGYEVPYPAFRNPTLTKTTKRNTFKPEEGCED